MCKGVKSGLQTIRLGFQMTMLMAMSVESRSRTWKVQAAGYARDISSRVPRRRKARQGAQKAGRSRTWKVQATGYEVGIKP